MNPAKVFVSRKAFDAEHKAPVISTFRTTYGRMAKRYAKFSGFATVKKAEG